MDWSRTKTIFILTFLILDLFLGYQFYEKKQRNSINMIAEVTVEEQFKTNEIAYIDLPKEPAKGTYLTGKSKQFSEAELEKLKGQTITLSDSTVLQAVLDKPVLLPDENINYFIEQFIQLNVIGGENYHFWSMNKESGKIELYQIHNGRMIYKNSSGQLTLFLSEKGEITSYKQTLLRDLEEFEQPKNLLPAIKVLENLYKKNLLKPGSKVTKVELGYYTLVPLTTSQVLTPTWHIIVDESNEYFVNAFEGQIISDQNKILE